MPIPFLAGAALTQIPKFISGIVQNKKANKALQALSEQEYPEFAEDPRMTSAYNRAQEMARFGFQPEERAAFRQDLAQSQGATFQKAIDTAGGQGAGAIAGMLQGQETKAINRFAAEGAQLKRSNIRHADQLAQQLQSQKNLQTQNLIARRQMLEQGYGAAKSSALENITGAFSGVGALMAQKEFGKKTGERGTENGEGTEEIKDKPFNELRDFDYFNGPDTR